MPSTPHLIDFRNVTVLRGQRKVLDSVTLAIPLGEHVAIVGPNGSGKSSLIKAITRELHPLVNAGRSHVKILGEERWNIFELRPQLGIVSPDWADLCRRDISAREALLSGFFSSTQVWPHNRVTRAMERRADEVLELLEITHLRDRETLQLSSGELRRVVIGRALVHSPKALILDEPTASLDFRATAELRRTLQKIAARGTTLVLVTHHLPDIIPEIQRVILLREGRIFRDGPKQSVLVREALSDLFEIPLELYSRDGYYSFL